MSEIKFTEEELKSLAELQTKSATITNRFGQLAIAKINLEKQNEAVEEEEFKLHEELESLKEDEQKETDVITKKYGPGQLDPKTGVFTPTVQVESPSE
jgi:predicted nuclease with TOPRIM domain